ncbi:hypothetical protein [Flavobacterium wongokense]|uniref:hypothetical protein n=1 Tax=Flavobacterium wongokense TaxID=2910674 RepID=UPI001F15A15A|nr:hypothetical protein [Flavobacterium sp. WG47]MCF6132498.1 hypothetical protein [Flavobacterium sp. WG47]
MKAHEILNPLTACTNVLESALLTTIHLINGDRIITEADVYESETDYEHAFGEFYPAGI